MRRKVWIFQEDTGLWNTPAISTIDIDTAPAPAGVRVITHEGDYGVALVFEPRMSDTPPGTIAQALRPWLNAARVLGTHAQHEVERRRNLPVRDIACERRITAMRWDEAKRVLMHGACSA